MNFVYFKIAIADVSETIFDASSQTNPYTMKKTLDEVYCLLKFEFDNIPFELLQLGYSSMTQDQAIAELASGVW